MNISHLRATFAVISALAMLSLAPPSLAQQKPPAAQPAPAVQQAPVAAQSPAPPPQATPAQAPASSAAVPQVSAGTSGAAAAPAESESRLLKSTTGALRELSPWSMFLSADVIVKAVMIGLAFASLVTWTIFIAKMIELTVVQRKLRAALAKVSDARSLAEAQFALGAKGSVLSSLLAAAMREARLSAGISSDG
ncbi:MAG: tonB-system energizer ExbB, partial [Bradyrhizobium sp.]